MKYLLLIIGCTILLSCHSNRVVRHQKNQEKNIISGHFEKLKQAADKTKLHQFLQVFPKGADLHSHLSGAVSADRLITIALSNDYYFLFNKNSGRFLKFLVAPINPNNDELIKNANEITDADIVKIKDAIILDNSDHDGSSSGRISAFNKIFGVLDELTDNTDIIPLLVKECMLDASNQNISYLELKLNPLGRKNSCGEKIKVDVLTSSLIGVVDRTNEMLQRKGRNPVKVRFIGTATRWSTLKSGGQSDTHDSINCSSQNCGRRLEQLYYLSTGVIPKSFVALDLVGLPEADIVTPKDTSIVEYFGILNSKFGQTNITMHAGESTDPNNNHIIEAIQFGAKRIGHAYNLTQVNNAIEQVCSQSIGIEISLSSNLALGFPISQNLSEHPFPKYFSNSICQNGGQFPVCLNTDDAGIFDTTLSNEYLKAALAFNLSYADIKTLALNSLEMSFLSDEEKKELIKNWKNDIQSFENKMAENNGF